MISLGYLAGIVDGEGTISFMSASRNRGSVGDIVHRPFMSISNTDTRLLSYLQDGVGVGKIFCNRSATETHAASYSWRVMGPNLLPLLRSVEPYLYLKRDQARLVIDWIERRVAQRTRPYSQADHDLVGEVKAMNQKGPHKFIGVR